MLVMGKNRLSQLATGLALMSLGAVVGAPRATADIASDHPAAILVFPKLLVDTANGLDTMVRISNVSDTPINVYCFYVNATPQCSIPQGDCFPDRRTCSAVIGTQTFVGECFPQWQPTDFIFRLTQDQPTGWLVSSGEGVNCRLLQGVCSNDGSTACQRDTDCGTGNRCVFPPCLPLDGGPLGRTGPNGQLNEGAVPLSPEDPFIGELKCIAVDETLLPVARNDLIGDVLIGRNDTGPKQEIDVAGYNAVGIPAIPGTGNRDKTLVIGGPAEAAEYEGCPNILILDHYFDGAVDPAVENVCQPNGKCSVSGVDCVTTPDCLTNRCLSGVACSVSGTLCAVDADCQNTCITTNLCMGLTCAVSGGACAGNADCPNEICNLSGDRCVTNDDCVSADFQVRVASDLTLIPCTQDFEGRDLDLSKTVAQFIVFNEFEQRFSTSRTVDCFKEIRLSNMETSDNTRSIFSAGVAGTLTGQSRIRGVVNTANAGRGGNALLGVVEEFRCAGPQYQFPLCNLVQDSGSVVSSTAKNLHFQGRRPQSDFVYLP
jgi:hypothetical protein